VIAALRTFETGQFFSASLAIRANADSSRFSTWLPLFFLDKFLAKLFAARGVRVCDALRVGGGFWAFTTI
jgi:hypothetical protein